MDIASGLSSGSRGLAFGPFLIDPVRRLLWLDRQVVPLTAKAFDVLVTLLEHRDRAMGKDELLKRIWPDTFVQENNLVRHVSMLRRALGQRADQHDYIVTIPGIGYRFVAHVAEVQELAADLPTAVEHVADPLDRPFAVENESDQAAVSEPEPIPLEAMQPSMVSPPLAAPKTFSGLRLWLALTVAAAVVASSAASGYFWRSDDAPTHRSLRQVTYGPDVQLGPTWSPDGRSLAFSSNRSGDFEIWVQSLDEPDPVRLTNSSGPDWQPSWSPDGKLIVFRSERDGGGIYAVSPTGEMLRRLSDFGYRPTWSPDSSSILFFSARIERIRPQAYVVGLDGAVPRPARSDLAADLMQTRAAWHPDGELTFWGRRGQDWLLRKAPLTGGDGKSYVLTDDMKNRLKELGVTLADFAWAPKGDFIFFEGRSLQVQNLWRVPVDPKTMTWKSAPERITLGSGPDADFSLSPDGTKIAFGAMTERTRVWSFPINPTTRRAGGQGEPLTSGGAGEYDATVSLDGRVLVYRKVRFGRQELWERSIADNRERLLIAGTDWLRSTPRVSPDGARIAYRLTRSAGGVDEPKQAVAIFDATRGEQVVTVPGATSLIPDDWAGDGASILGTCPDNKTNRFSICAIETRRGTPVRVVRADADRDYYSAHYSPNQRWISVIERPVPRGLAWTSTITVLPAEGGQRVRVTDGKWNDEKPRWGSDGKVLYFLSNRSGFLNIWGRLFDPNSGLPVGDIFKVTNFNDLRYTIPTDMSQVEIGVSVDRIYLPVTELSATIWSLEGVSR